MLDLDGFRVAIADAGLTPPDAVIPDGKMHRFASNGKKGDDAGWYVLHGDGLPAGAFGCWRSGIQDTWSADIGRELTPEERRANQERIDAIKRQRKAERDRLQAEAAKRAATIWNRSPAAVTHQYLMKKDVGAYELRLHKDLLVIPVRDVNGLLHSLEFIRYDGRKRFIKDSQIEGCYHQIGEPDEILCVTEGYATGATVHVLTRQAVAIAFNRVNLMPVCIALRKKYRDVTMLICADNDHETEGNPGLTDAREAAKKVGGIVAIPECEGTDFNDMYLERGADAVKNVLRSALRLRDAS